MASALASASRKRGRQAQEDDEVATHGQRDKAVNLSGAGVKGRDRGGHDDHEAAASKGPIEGRPSGQEDSLDFVGPLPKLIVLDLDKTVRSVFRVLSHYHTR